MKSSVLVGVLLILMGAAVLGYGHFSYKTEEKIIDIGPIEATAERTKRVPLPPILGWACVGSGLAVLVLGAMQSKR